MTSILAQIQADVLDEGVSVSTLLRKVKLAAHKLGLEKVEEWINDEMNGYQGIDNLPDYRKIKGTPVARNPMYGWQPMIGDLAHFDRAPVHEGIGGLENMLAGDSKASLLYSFPAEICKALDEHNGLEWGGYAVRFNVVQLHAITSAVRNRVLEWAIALEKAGVVGEGLEFDSNDKKKAQAAATSIRIGVMHNHGSAIGIGSSNNISKVTGVNIEELTALIEQLKEAEPSLRAAGLDTVKLGKAAEGLESELKKDQIDDLQIGSWVNDIRNVLSGAGGNIIAQAFMHALPRVLGS